MILGRGTATTDQAIGDDYRQFLQETGHITHLPLLQKLSRTPEILCQRLGKPIGDWSDDELIALYQMRRRAARYHVASFLAFLLFRGYRRGTLGLLTALQRPLALQHKKALQPLQEKIAAAQRQLGYKVIASAAGSELNLLAWLLSVVHKPLDELTRADFDAFRRDYLAWYQGETHCPGAGPDSRLARLEAYLIHAWRILPPPRPVFRHEEYLAELSDTSLKAAMLSYLRQCEARDRPTTLERRRLSLRTFSRWLQQNYPLVGRLDEITRPIAIAYVTYLQGEHQDGRYAATYINGHYGAVRLFYQFAIEEQLPTCSPRNPFTAADLPREPDPVMRYLPDQVVHRVLAYCAEGASLQERTMVLTLLHTGIRAAELLALRASDIVQIQGTWKLHVHAGKGLKDRVIPLTPQCRAVLQEWQEAVGAHGPGYLFTHFGRPYQRGTYVAKVIGQLGKKLGIAELTPHRFRHTFAVALLNYGMRESALQKLMGHASLNMTLEYGRILDRTVEQSFNNAVEQMQVGPLSWVPSFFAPEEYTLLVEGDAVSYIRLPHGYCRRNPKLHCESDVKCLLCDRYTATPADLPRLREMHERFHALGLSIKAEVVATHVRRLEGQDATAIIPLRSVSTPTSARGGATR